MIKEITVFTNGDANDIRTWSNVPYFLTKTIEEKGIKVNRVNISGNIFLFNFFGAAFKFIFKFCYKNSDYTYFRTSINQLLTSKKINKAVKKYPNSDVFLFLTYSFSIEKKNKKKIVLFGDWTYLYKITKLDNREPYWFERYSLNKEQQNINQSDVVFSLFPKSKDFIRDHFKNKNVHYLGNVINSNFPVDKEKLILSKINSKKIIFIGNLKYIQGALDLIEAYHQFNTINSNAIELHIIGLSKRDIPITNHKIICHGYLDKGNATEYKLYYQLISEARVIVNTTKNWGGFSAMTEAMYYYTPVITSPYEEFVKTYGERIDFGYYITKNTKTELVEILESIFKQTDLEYIALMEQAHAMVKDFLWSSYIDKVLNKIA